VDGHATRLASSREISASSDAGKGQAAADPTSGGDASDPAAGTGRRSFIRELAADAVRGAASIAGTVGALQRAASDTAGAIVGESVARSAPEEQGRERQRSGKLPQPFRLERGRLLIVDQRQLPEAVVELDVSAPTDLAAAMRDHAVDGAALLAQVAVFGLVLTAERVRDTSPDVRSATLSATANVLAEARPTVAAVRSALDRLMAFASTASTTERSWQAGSERRLRLWLRRPSPRMHYSQTRAASCSFADTRSPDPRDARADGTTRWRTRHSAWRYRSRRGDRRDMTVHVAESRPLLQGSRLTAWELREAGIPTSWRQTPPPARSSPDNPSTPSSLEPTPCSEWGHACDHWNLHRGGRGPTAFGACLCLLHGLEY